MGRRDNSEPPAAGRLLRDLPEVLTVEEAARVLRIGRRVAYEQAQLWRETGGREGLPVIVIGRSLRVPKAELELMLRPSARPNPAARPHLSSVDRITMRGRR